MSKRTYIFATLGLLAMIYGVYGLKHTQDASIFGLFNQQLKQVNRKYEAHAGVTGAVAVAAAQLDEVGKPELSLRYSYYRNCLEAPKPCPGFPDQDGDLYLSEVRNQMLSEVTALFLEIKNNPETLQHEHEKSAQLMLTDATPDIQILGFQILELFPISEINLDLVAQTTEDAFDMGVVNAGLQELERYKETPAFQSRVAAALVQQIGLGVNDQAAIQAIEKLPVFLNAENKKQFQDLLAQLKESSRKSSGVQRRYKTLERVFESTFNSQK